MGNLSATTLRSPLAKGRYHDGDGLFLSVTGKGARSWICRVQKNGRRRDIGIGSAKKITLSQARQRAAEIRALVEAGIDPVLHRKRAEGVKADQEHVVPLSDAALAVLKKAEAHKQKDNDLVFPGTRHAKPMSDMTLTKICRDAGVDAVPHGFRSSFRDWVSEETDFDGDIAEMALAHTIANPVEAAYRRGNLLQKRRKMMDDWTTYCAVTRS